ncbi:MAG: 50S ribosomal protein L23 [Deltaproteobacteria bacterium]|nr:50S ribosomal protein L23 [Deltaproteobacteria bacterium]
MNIKLLKHPHLTEKSVTMKETENRVTFLVEPAANKTEIKKTVEKLFNVTVITVRTSKVRGKMKRVGRNIGRRPDSKKAIIKLKAGDKIEYFEGA